MEQLVTRRRFLKQTLAFSALAGVPSLSRGALAPGDPAAKHVLLLGDWGWADAAQGQQQVAAGMREYALAHKLKPEALLLLGDSWYGSLEGGADSPRWDTQFEQMYPADVFPGPAYTLLGNHDYQHAGVDKVQAELEYARRAKTSAGKPMRWKLPSPWYRFELPEKKPLMTVIALDSNVPGHHSFGPGFYTMHHEAQQQQLAWLQAELAKPLNTPFLAVAGHHPIYSNGKHGDHPILIRDWDPLLREHKVHFYFAGHDHDLQHLEFEGHPTSFFCSGAGGADLYTLRQSQAERGPFAQKTYGFSHMELTPERVTLRHLDERGNVLHAFAKTAEGKVEMLA